MVRRFNILLLAILLVAMAVSAGAETQVREVKARDIQVSRLTDVLAIREDGADYYKLITADGQDLTGAIYSDIRPIS